MSPVQVAGNALSLSWHAHSYSEGACVRERQCEIKGWGLAGIYLYRYQLALSAFCWQKILRHTSLTLSGQRKLLLDTVYDRAVRSGTLDKMISCRICYYK